MSCPARERIAAAAADEDPRAAAHADSCARCAELLADQREVRALAHSLPAPQLAPDHRALLGERVARDAAPITHAELAAVLAQLRPPALDADRRTELAATVLAAADAGDRGEVIYDDGLVPFARSRGPRVAIIASLAAAAAIALVVAWSATRGDSARTAARATSTATDRGAPIATAAHAPTIRTPTPAPPAPRDHLAAHDDVAVTAPPDRAVDPASDDTTPAAIIAQGADFSRSATNGADRVELRDGVLDIDTRGHAAVAVAIGSSTFTVRAAHVELVAANGVIVSAHAFAGSVERATDGEAHTVIAAGDVWTPPAGPATSLASFRAGWQALHAGRTAAALAAFDLATDPVTAEDAAFWAAIAAQRLDDRDGARRRFRAFLAAFPASPRADSARRALAQLDL